MPVPWTSALTDLRIDLSDGDTDKYRARKDIVGSPDGNNVTFRTLEKRRITDFTAPATSSEGVYVNGALVSVTSDDLVSGEFVLGTAPNEGDRIQASYYMRFFDDSELTSFLVSASEWLGLGATFANVAEGLQPAAREYAAFKAFQKLAGKSQENMSEMYRMEDSPNPNRKSPMEQYMSIANSKYKMAVSMRDDFYKRGGRREAPSSSNLYGTFDQVTPNK